MTLGPGEGEKVALDLRGLKCPLPVLRARKAAKGLSPGTLLEVLASDPRARDDFPAFCENDGHALLDCAAEGDTLWRFRLRIGG